jgi:tetratricopeptide (TPR) repeat protein
MRPLFARLRLESDDCNRPSEFNPPLGYTRSHLRDPYRGLTYARKGEYDRAIQDYDQAIRLNPKDAKALLYRGIAQFEQGKFDAPA